MPEIEVFEPRNTLNLLITVGIAISASFLLWLASHGGLAQTLFAAVLFSIVLQPNYVLLHEGAHGNHHQNAIINWLMSSINGVFFPISFTFYRLSHGFHHENNRGEDECFEYYDPQQSLWRRIYRYLQWYGILLGTFWVLVLVMNLVVATVPWLFKLWPLNSIAGVNRMFSRFNTKELKLISLETGLVAVLWIALWHILELRLGPTLLLFAAFAFNWSTRQYIAHAFSPLDKDTGAYNLKLGSFAQTFLLNSNYHLVHHQNPDLPWHLLPAHADQPPRIGYWQQYCRLWTAPRVFPAFETSTGRPA